MLLETPRRGNWTLHTPAGAVAVRSGEALAVAAGVPHRLVTAGGRGMTSDWVMIQWQVDGRVARLAAERAVWRDPAAVAAIRAVAGLRAAPPGLAREARLQAAELSLLAALADRLILEAVPDPRIARVLEYLPGHLGEVLTRARLAALAGLSETRFHEVFRAATGEAPLQRVNRLRLERAALLLLQTGQPVAQVAESCGFESAAYFSRFFRAKMGLPPRRFREQHPPNAALGG